MKLFSLIFIQFLLLAQPPQGKTISLTWLDPLNSSSTTYNIYRAPISCNITTPFLTIKTGVTSKTYDDLNVQPGTYCYYITAVNGTSESIKSPKIDILVPYPPVNPTGKIR